nr:basic salivary proline-rich protein 2-like [Ovis aries]
MAAQNLTQAELGRSLGQTYLLPPERLLERRGGWGSPGHTLARWTRPRAEIQACQTQSLETQSHSPGAGSQPQPAADRPPAEQTQTPPSPGTSWAPALHTSSQRELRDPPGLPPDCRELHPHQWSPTPGPAPESPGPTPPPVSRHQPGALGFWKQPPRDQTLLASSVHTGQGRATHPPARAPVIARGEGTPRTLPPHPGQETEPRDGKQMESGQEEPAEEHAPDEEQDRPQQQTREMRDGPRAAGVQSGDCGWSQEACTIHRGSCPAQLPRGQAGLARGGPDTHGRDPGSVTCPVGAGRRPRSCARPHGRGPGRPRRPHREPGAWPGSWRGGCRAALSLVPTDPPAADGPGGGGPPSRGAERALQHDPPGAAGGAPGPPERAQPRDKEGAGGRARGPRPREPAQGSAAR